MLFILPTKQKVDICISILQIGTLKPLDAKVFAERHKISELKMQVSNSQTTFTLKHCFPNDSISVYPSTSMSMSAREHAPMQRHTHTNQVTKLF